MHSNAISNMPNGGLIVAVDGPSGAGKSTICRTLAAQLGAKYLDTGAMYRVATLHVLREGIDPQDAQAVAQATEALPLSMNDDPASREVLLAGMDVQHEIRGPEVTNAVSAVSAVPAVRENLVRLQRTLATQAHRCIVDGRDIGTNVLTDAPVKVFLTASPEVRAQRRFEQDRAAGREVIFEQVLADVVRRDELDSTRALSPLRPAEDATIVDTSELNLHEAIEAVLTLIERSAERSKQ
ncbi:(d)CMP kinase [Corynebacterium kozikiae]|uniref:(d)CMP kinase n=1 Tax=Corynebacterium kozikiae TaxID=2968469 RepID=UPI00211C3A70|nr:(d)CMP kinase [Corynebacterium sp. 76QC2CO]MCQ9343872.1 (d)CMP kinase [Corynebacterium sp. 76QC2CO]